LPVSRGAWKIVCQRSAPNDLNFGTHQCPRSARNEMGTAVDPLEHFPRYDLAQLVARLVSKNRPQITVGFSRQAFREPLGQLLPEAGPV
jgi:hypothetical protein